jgi:hypothetical protein
MSHDCDISFGVLPEIFGNGKHGIVLSQDLAEFPVFIKGKVKGFLSHAAYFQITLTLLLLHIKEHRKTVRMPGTGRGVSMAGMHAVADVQTDYNCNVWYIRTPFINSGAGRLTSKETRIFLYDRRNPGLLPENTVVSIRPSSPVTAVVVLVNPSLR